MIRQFTKEFRIIQNADRLAERIFLSLTLFFIAFIIFASCFLTNSPKYKFKSNVFLQIISMPSLDYALAYHNLGDIATNVLFYIPLGLFLSLTVSFRKPRFFTPWLLLGFFLSAFMEISQYFIGRYADPVDLLTNTLGSIFGFWLGVFAIKYFGLRPAAVLGINPDDQTSTKVNTIASIRFLYIAVYLVSSFLPFDLTFHFSHIYAKLHPDKYGQFRLILDPFYHFLRWNHDAEAVIGLFLGLLPVGILTAILGGFHKKLKPLGPVIVCFLLAAVCEAGQVFVFSRTSDILMLPLAIAAGVLGWLIALVWFMLQDFEGYSFFESANHRNMFLLFIMAGYFLILLLAILSPYHFEYSLKAIEQKLVYQTNWVPFRNQLEMRNVETSFWLVRNVGAFIPMGLLLTFWMRIHFPLLERLWVISIAGFFCALSVLILELFRVMGVGYYSDVTNVFLGCCGGIMGSIFFRFLAK